MSDFQIITDSCADLPEELSRELGVIVVPLSVEFRGGVFEEGVGLGVQELYDGLRNGEVAKTAAANPEKWKEFLEPCLRQGKDVLVLAFSSGLSTTYQSAVIAAQELSERYPRQRIRVEDTLCASMGQGLLVWYACRQKQNGMSLEETAKWVEENRLHLCHWFTVDDLMYLHRGGRIRAATALVGTMLKIKPVLHVDDEGHLINVGKARGRRASMDALAAKIAELALPGENDTMFISHGDCIDDARYLESVLRKKYAVKNVVIHYVGCVIGSHSGPGTLALFFLGKHR